MKKTFIASVLGVAGLLAMSASSYGQGSFIFENYSFGASSLNSPVTYATSGTENGNAVTAGETVGDPSFQVQFYYELQGQSSYTLYTAANALAANGNTTYPAQFEFGGGSNGSELSYSGDFFGNTITIPTYTSGAVSFYVQAFDGTTYGQSGYWSGQSAVFSVSALATGDNSPNDFGGGTLQPFTVSFISAAPEPGTLALAGLGGLASLVAMRRRKA